MRAGLRKEDPLCQSRLLMEFIRLSLTLEWLLMYFILYIYVLIFMNTSIVLYYINFMIIS